MSLWCIQVFGIAPLPLSLRLWVELKQSDRDSFFLDYNWHKKFYKNGCLSKREAYMNRLRSLYPKNKNHPAELNDERDRNSFKIN